MPTELVVTPSAPPPKIGQASVSYDADSNRTLVGVSLMVLTKPKGDLSDLWVGFILPGKELTKPGVVEFNLLRSGWAGSGGRVAFEFRSAGKVFKLDNVKMERHISDGRRKQVLTGNIPFATFEQIAASDQLQVHAGSLLLVLRDTDREGIRDLLKAASGAPVDK